MFEGSPRLYSISGSWSSNHVGTSLSLPRGACRFILLHPQVTGQRCACQGYVLNSRVPDSSCECGHQACYHVPDVPSPAVSMEEHVRLAEMVRGLSERLEKERAEREKDMQGIYQSISGVYHNMNGVHESTRTGLLDLEDKLDGAIDKAQSLYQDLKVLKERVACIDDASMDLELRVEDLQIELDHRPRAPSPSKRRSRRPKNMGTRPFDKLPVTNISINTPSENSWEAYVIIVPGTTFEFQPGDIADLRCRSRGLFRWIIFSGPDQHSIMLSIDSAFHDVLQGRRWVPARAQIRITNGISNLIVGNDLSESFESNTWDASFLRGSCAASLPANHLPVIFVTLRDSRWTWESIRNLSPVPGLSQRCWDHNERLDGVFAKPSIPEARLPVTSRDSVAITVKKQAIEFDKSPLDLLASLASMPVKRQFSELSRSIPEGSDGKILKRPRPLQPTLEPTNRRRIVSS
ncbi:hypothetical protein L228DRAFT_148115 [Xylona heveae TC161]|uniref:Uncharacterized protein n=1 Tax=Xylona heveae (strain CBS 132557 / TC161) TaxID=1328760 RepID=A0A165GHL8_XYLHT|nr:hypothetical protein L228DRAFT_148115 [Xylona heveae TC161]KZF22195.1 hypothetical protein L228DRAFT_148115 [Xylona heveae TC161]